MVRKAYTASEHQKAFEVWYETKNLMHAARTIGCEYTTIRDWMLDTYNCRWNCQWHGYERLRNEVDAAKNARNLLLEQGNVDPIDHQQAMTEAVDRSLCDDTDSFVRRKLAVDAIVRSDLERISHFELLYGKILQEATGIATDPKTLIGFSANSDGATLKSGSMEAAIKSLISLTNYIKTLKEDLGVTKSRTTSTVSVTVDVEEPQPTKELTIDELRQFKDMIEHAPPEKVDLLKKMMDADDEQVRLAISGKVEESAEYAPDPIDDPGQNPSTDDQNIILKVITEDKIPELPPPAPPEIPQMTEQELSIWQLEQNLVKNGLSEQEKAELSAFNERVQELSPPPPPPLE